MAIPHLEHVGHLADLKEGAALSPLVHDVHHEGFKLLHILVFLHFQLSLFRHPVTKCHNYWNWNESVGDNGIPTDSVG